MPRHSSILDHPRRERADALILAGDRPISAIARELGLPIESFKRYARRLRVNGHAPVPLPAMSPIETFERAFGFPPMPHQRAYLEDKRPTVVLKSSTGRDDRLRRRPGGPHRTLPAGLDLGSHQPQSAA